ncbi:MarR family transcriptional regulator [Aminipila butyrica]|uniref:MarR family transcriptional regulator n=2 Tax=Aminipila butyrica TaxID=433296 RepID=A0A858C022_9FIRM|nr:MarR family transcriptional regulator [Aminipila butyrica]
MLMHRTWFSHFAGAGKSRNPHRGQGRILALLKLKPQISQKELTYLLNMSKQAVAELIAKLERNGYITREPSEEDKRVMTIRLTEEGAKAADHVDDAASETVKILDCFNEEELITFSEYLGRIIQQYEEQFPDEDFEQRRRHIEAFMALHGGGFRHGCKSDFDGQEHEHEHRHRQEHRHGHGFGHGHKHGFDRHGHDNCEDFKGCGHHHEKTEESPAEKKQSDEEHENRCKNT